MTSSRPPTPLLCVLLCVTLALQRTDLRLAYVTHNSFFYYSCSQEPPPCSVASLTDCRCKDIQLSTLHHPHSHSSPVFRMKRLTVWFTSPSNTARLLNNSEVRHLTLIHCGAGGSREMTSSSSSSSSSDPSSSLQGHFAVQHLERLTVVDVPQRLPHYCPDANRAWNTDSNGDPDHSAHLDSNRSNRDLDSNLDLIPDVNKDSVDFTSTHVQDILLGRELGAACHEQARLGIIHSSVLEWGATVKAYTVQTHIDSDGVLPFPELQLPKLPATPVIYVSFVY